MRIHVCVVSFSRVLYNLVVCEIYDKKIVCIDIGRLCRCETSDPPAALHLSFCRVRVRSPSDVGQRTRPETLDPA